MSDVLAAYTEFCHPLDDKQLVYFQRKGIHPDTFGFDDKRKLFRVMCATIQPDNLSMSFGFGSPGLNAVIFVCRNELGNVEDLAAWLPKTDDVRLWNNAVSMLGEEACLSPRVEPDKLWVRKSVIDWLVHRRTGVVIVRPEAARVVLTAGSPVAVTSGALKNKLEAAWKAPQILVINDGVAASTMEAVG